MRERPNVTHRLDDSSSELRNDLYRSLEPTFDHILQTEDPARYSLGEEAYVNHPEMEEVVKSFCHGDTNQAAYLVGATGIGKSTLLRHTLGVNRTSFIRNGTLYIPFSLNQRIIEDRIEMRTQIGSALRQAVWVAKGGTQSFFDAEDKKKIADLLLETSPDLAERPELDSTKLQVDRALEFIESKAFAYQTSQIALKHFASSNDGIRRVVLILDDLEGAREPKLQEEAVLVFLQTCQCLMNGPAAAQRVPVRLLVGLRPETHAWVAKLKHNVTVTFRDLAYTKPVALAEIFRKRFDAVHKKDDYQHLRDPNRLQTALRVLNAIGDTLGGRFSARLVELCNHDLRSSLEHYRRITCNRRWLQKDQEWEPFFKVDELNFALSQASVIRALGMGEGDVYPQNKTCIANLLWNRREESSDFLLLYVVKYLLHKTGRSATKDTITGLFEKVLGNANDQEMVSDVLEYGLSNGLLHEERANESLRISLTPRAHQIYDMLEQSTLAFSLFYDDICQPLTRTSSSRKPLMLLSGAAEGFINQARLLGELWAAEIALRATFTANHAPEAGSTYFGTTFECARMRIAFRKSLEAFYPATLRPDYPEGVKLALAALNSLAIPRELRDGTPPPEP